MTTTYPMRDSLTMLRRNLRRMQRYPSLTLMLLGQPILFLLLFVYVFGGTLGNGLGSAAVGGTTGRAAYIGFVTPTILIITITGAILGTAISVAMDMTQGITARFRTMSISKASVLTGHVIGTFIQTALGLAVVLSVALLVGFRPSAGPVEWLAVIGLFLTVTLALSWMAVALGLSAKSVETASNTPLIFTLLPFLGSGFVPNDSLPSWQGAHPLISGWPRIRARPSTSRSHGPADRERGVVLPRVTAVRITIRVRPGSRRDQIGGSYAGALIVRVRQRADRGMATAAALSALAEALGVPKRDVRLVAGATSRTKIVEIPDTASSRVMRLLQGPPSDSEG